MTSAASNVVHIGTNPGPQSQAFASTATVTVYGGGAGGGKALSLGTPIATPQGWTTMSELVPGDVVFAPDGSQTTVTWCSDVQHGRECFDVVFSDGTVIVADAEHLWWTFTYAERVQSGRRSPEARAKRRAKRPSRSTGKRPDMASANATRAYRYKDAPEGGIRTTREIAGTLTARRTHNNHSVPVTKPIECTPRELPIHPYVLGLWLGDGTADTGVITKPDVELDAFIAECGYECHRVASGPMSIRVSGLTAQLRALGVLERKHIPAEYLRASVEQRMALAQGLMDSDGYASPESGDAEFVTTTPELRDGALELLLSLGCKAVMGEGRAKLNGEDYGPKWRVLVMSHLPLFRLPRKLAHQKRDGFRGTHDQRYIVAVNSRASVPVRCIRVDHPTHCFLAGREMVPTHNTHLALLRSAVHADRNPGYEAIIFRREFKQVLQAGGLWEESMKMFPVFGAKPNSSEHFWRWKRQNAHGSLIQFKGIEHETDLLNYQGAQLAEFDMDEATHFSDSMFWWMFSRLRSTNCPTFRPRCVLTCNPDPDSWVAKLIEWYIGEDGFPVPDRAGKKRWFVRDGNELVWGSTPGEVRALARHITCDPKNQPKSLRFIPALLKDNPRGDPNYESMLNALPLVERERLKGGNWKIRSAAGTVFKRAWYGVVEAPPAPADVVQTVRFWDLAATEPNVNAKDPDWTRGVKMSRLRNGMFVTHDVASIRARAHDVEALVRRTADLDGRRCSVGTWQDPGAAGKAESERYRTLLAGFDVRILRASNDKLTNARAASSQAEGGNIKLMRGPWNEAFLSEHESFPDGKHDDIVDAESGCMQVLTSGAPVTSFSHNL